MQFQNGLTGNLQRALLILGGAVLANSAFIGLGSPIAVIHGFEVMVLMFHFFHMRRS